MCVLWRKKNSLVLWLWIILKRFLFQRLERQQKLRQRKNVFRREKTSRVCQWGGSPSSHRKRKKKSLQWLFQDFWFQHDFIPGKELVWLIFKKRKIKRLVKEPSRQILVTTVGPWQDILGEGWWGRQFSHWLPRGWDLTPKGREKMWKPSPVLHCKCFSALPLGRSSQRLERALVEILEAWQHSQKVDAVLKAKNSELHHWARKQEKEHWHRRLHKETLLLWQKSLLMRAAFSGLLGDISEPPDSSLASLLELRCDLWARPFCTLFPEGLINSSWIFRNPEDFL